jgi:hypothetical protein
MHAAEEGVEKSPGMKLALACARSVFTLASVLMTSFSGIAQDRFSDEVYPSHDTWMSAQPGAMFFSVDRLESTNVPIVSTGTHRLTWRAYAPNGTPSHVTLQGNTLSVNGRRGALAKAIRFPGESWVDLGLQASLYVHGADLCVEGVPPSASGRAQRHVQVLFAPGALRPRGGRASGPLYQLPSLFASCAGIRRDEAVGLNWVDHVLTPVGFKSTGVVQQVEFVEPGNVYRFRVLPLVSGATGLKPR